MTKTFYYIKLPNDEVFIGDEFALGLYRMCKDGDKIEVLSEVPSYEEYQQLLSDQLAKNEGVEINAELEARLKKTQELELEVRQENAKLKELLKRVNEHFKWVDFDDINYVDYELWGDIKKALGEE